MDARLNLTFSPGEGIAMAAPSFADDSSANPIARIFRSGGKRFSFSLGEGRVEEDNNPTLPEQPFAVGLVVAVPAAQGGVADVLKRNRNVGDSTWRRKRRRWRGLDDVGMRVMQVHKPIHA